MSARGGYGKNFPNFSYEVKCDLLNEIIEPEDFKNKIRLKLINKSLKPSFTFERFKTTNTHCVITGYEIQKANVTGITIGPYPSREISVPSDV